MTDVEAARAAMASMLVAALEEAERERDLSVAREPTSAELAAAAWSKLQYDFPVVSPAELDALAKEMEAEAGGGTGPPPAGAPLAYAPTNPLVAAVIEGASRAPADAAADDASASALRRAFQRLCAVVLVRLPARLAKAGAARADAFLAKYFIAEISDETRTVERAFETDERTSVDAFGRDEQTHDSAEESRSSRAGDADDRRDDAVATPRDADSDSDWEPLEGPVGADPSRFGSHGTTNARLPRLDDDDFSDPEEAKSDVEAKLRDLVGRARYAYFDAKDSASLNGASAEVSAWTLRGVGAAATELVESFASISESDARFDDRSVCGHALALLRERWRVAGVGADAADAQTLTRCLRALGLFKNDGGGAQKSVLDAGARRSGSHRACVETLGFLCSSFVLFTNAGTTTEHDRVDEERRARALWPIAAEALAPVASALDASLAEFKLRDGFFSATRDGDGLLSTERLDAHMAACCSVIAFYAARAPGNAAVGTELLKSGALRAAAALFCVCSETGKRTAEDDDAENAEYGALVAEAARRCLLLASAASPDAAAFALAVPGVRRALETGDLFGATGACAAHGALWELAFTSGAERGKTTSAEEREKACAARFAASIIADPAVAVDALGLLRLVQLASRARGRDAGALFSDKPDSALRLVLREAANAHAAVVAAAAKKRADAARGAAAATRKPSSSDDESESESFSDDAPHAPPTPARSLGVADETEKRAAAASAALRLIKEIVDGFRGGAGARKCD
jgi:hypothetical protein